MARGKAVAIKLSAAERVELERRVRRRKSSHGAARRARIVLLAAEGLSNSAIAAKLGVSRLTVGTWRRRVADKQVGGLEDEPRPGAPRKIGDDKIAEVVTRTLEVVPDDATHWSRRSMARASGISATTVHRIWGAFGLQPHRVGDAPVQGLADARGTIVPLKAVEKMRPARDEIIIATGVKRRGAARACRCGAGAPWGYSPIAARRADRRILVDVPSAYRRRGVPRPDTTPDMEQPMAYRDLETGRARDRERFRKRTAEHRAKGLCPRCGLTPPTPGRSLCETCAGKVASPFMFSHILLLQLWFQHSVRNGYSSRLAPNTPLMSSRMNTPPTSSWAGP